MNPNEILRADPLDILFEHRNKDYGAYELRRHYQKRMTIALTAPVLLFALFYFLSITGGNETSYRDRYVYKEHDVSPDVKIIPENPPRLPVSPAAPSVSQQVFTGSIRITTNEQPLNTVPPASAFATAVPSGDTATGTGNPEVPVIARPSVAMPVIPQQPQTSRFEPEEIGASFPGGPEALREFMAANLIVPEQLEEGEKRTVHIRFVIGPDGRARRFEIIKSAGSECDEEVLRVCRRLPKWIPAKQNGIFVESHFTLPVTFVKE